MRSSPAVALLLLAAACGGDGAANPDAGGECVADLRPTGVYFGSTTPSYAPLTPGQILAVGAWTGSVNGGEISCSGTLIAPQWVLTADHCGISVGDFFCFGPNAADPVGCIAVDQVHTAPTVNAGGGTVTLDMTVARLEVDATTRITGVEPIPVVIDSVEDHVGEMAETAGFGATETGDSGARLFAVELLDNVGGAGPDFLTVDGMGLRGVCYGDSGGPAMVIDFAGAARVAGTLTGGDSSCVGRDNYTRADLALAWIEQYTGPTPIPKGAPCGSSLDEVGRCSGGRALWCDDGTVASETCAAGQTCGWDAATDGYRCITGADPCGGFDSIGGCDGDVARWCVDGAPKGRDCSCLDQLCTVDGTLGGAYCIDDPCMGIDYLGHCVGDVAEWCDGGQLQMEDCAAGGQTCGFVNDEIGYYCMN